MNKEVKAELLSVSKRAVEMLIEAGASERDYKDRGLLLFEIEHDEPRHKDWYSRLTELFKKHHPEYAGQEIGTSGGAMTVDASLFIRHMTSDLFRVSRNPTEEAMGALVNQFEAFTDSDTIDIDHVAPLINFSSKIANAVEVLPGVVLRALSAEERGDVVRSALGSMSAARPAPQWGFSSRISHRKLVGGFRGGQLPDREDRHVPELLDTAIRVLRTFKSGPVYYHAIFDRYVGFTPFAGSTARAPSRFSHATGTYSLEEGEVRGLRSHAATFRVPHFDDSMELACDRLEDAEVRLTLRDQLLDAVIGLEAILLQDRAFRASKLTCSLFASRPCSLECGDWRPSGKRKRSTTREARSLTAVEYKTWTHSLRKRAICFVQISSDSLHPRQVQSTRQRISGRQRFSELQTKATQPSSVLMTRTHRSQKPPIPKSR